MDEIQADSAQKHPNDEGQNSLDNYLLEVEKDYRIDYKCANCILEFTKQVIAYLKDKHFLIIEGEKITSTPLGKAAFASSISPEESQLIFNDLLEAR